MLAKVITVLDLYERQLRCTGTVSQQLRARVARMVARTSWKLWGPHWPTDVHLSVQLVLAISLALRFKLRHL